MSADQDSSTERIVYVRLLGEGTSVFRPVAVREIRPGTYELLAPEDFDSEDEEWEFHPGSLVDVEVRELGGEQVIVAIRLSERNHLS